MQAAQSTQELFRLAGALVITNLRGAIVGPLSLTVEAGACAAISGPSGAGKSLLLRMIADLDPNEGTVHLGDLDRASTTAPAWRRHTIHLAAEPGWWAERVDAHFEPARQAAALALTARLGLPSDIMAREIRTLSTGERQRLALVRALSRGPRCLLLDEPTSALDPDAVANVEALLRETMAEGMVLVLVSHDASQAERLGTSQHTLVAGRWIDA